MSITVSEAQAKAISIIRDWYLNRRHQQQILRVFGYAGAGKTTITAMAIEALGLEPMTPGGLGGVLFAAFTGKAALVMTRKGTPAQTIHSLIYRHSEASPEEIERVTKEFEALERDLPRMGPAERGFAQAQIAQLKLRLDHIHEPQFVLNPQSDLRDADLLVLDEAARFGAGCRACARNLAGADRGELGGGQSTVMAAMRTLPTLPSWWPIASLKPEVQEALDRGRAKEHDRLVAKLHELAMEGNVTAVIFALKARHAYREGEAPEGGSTNVQVNINLPSAMTPEEYQRMVDVTPGDEPD